MKLHLEFDRPYQAAAVEAVCDCWGSLNTGVTNRHLNPSSATDQESTITPVTPAIRKHCCGAR